MYDEFTDAEEAYPLEKEIEMEKAEIEKLARDYETALLEEYKAKIIASNKASEAEAIEAGIVAAAYADGTIDGKNTETRKAQERGLLVASTDYQLALGAQATADTDAMFKKIERERVEALVSLTKAWLYSQGGK
jgi:hypothetical protein